MPPNQLAQVSEAVLSLKNHDKGYKKPWIIIIASCLVSVIFVLGSLLYPKLFNNSLLSYLIILAAPAAAFSIYLLSKKPLQLDEQHITKLEQVSQSLNQQANLYYAILQSIKEGMIITDNHGFINFCNKQAAQILQTDSSAVVNQPLSRISEDKDFATNTLSDFQLMVTTSLGKRIILKINSFPLLSNSQIQGTIYLIADVTGEGEFERLKLDFVAQAAHQLRTPLTILKSYLSVLSDSIANQLSPDNRENLNRAVVGANQLSLLIENLLNVSRIEGGKLDLHPQATSIDQIISQAIIKNGNNATEKQIKIFYQQASTLLPQIIVDPNLIEQAISNLLSNAIENSHPNSDITISVNLQKQFLVVSVMDQGVGIPSEATNNLFTKFYKVSSNLVQASKGIGLGLYNTKAIVEAHGGTISVNSILGKGSTFWFTIPLRK